MDRYVVFVSSNGTEDRHMVSCRGAALVGRSDEASIHLLHPLVSRRHAEIAPDAGGFIVRDLGSRNGTTIDGDRFQGAERAVPAGTVIQVGPFFLTLGAVGGDEETRTLPLDEVHRVVRLDRELRRVLVESEVAVAHLSDLEFQLMQVLESRQPAAVTNRALGDIVWGEGRWDTYMLHNLVRRVRRKLEDSGYSSTELLVTVPGVGYRLA